MEIPANKAVAELVALENEVMIVSDERVRRPH
jgi:hypothetical protein